VATYWWGIGNINQNLQNPCPSDLNKLFDERLEQFMTERPNIFRYSVSKIDLRKILKNKERLGKITESEKKQKKLLDEDWNNYVKSVKTNPNNKQALDILRARIREEEFKKEGSHPGIKFSEMIQDWEAKCTQANVNFVALNTEFERGDYQNAINGKPLFIKKILDAVAPRAVLYIDGDMWINKYPHIFDIDNVDFMARNWNIDSRSKAKGLKNPYYDPYTFETSGGTMFFANTQNARKLLDMWETESARPELAGKADDRILSQLITEKSLTLSVNIVGLPIEYLWLTLDYQNIYDGSPDSAASIEDVYIEHPACLTAEETASEQGACINRAPENYEENICDNIIYNRPTELIYEYIMFDGNRNMRNGFNKYHIFMKSAKNFKTKNVLMNIVDFDNRYGEYENIARKNLSAVQARPEGTPGILSRGNLPAVPRQKINPNPSKVPLPLNAPIPEILKILYSGNDVEIGGSFPNVNPEDEIAGFNISKKSLDWYTRSIELNLSKPIFISSKSAIVKHLLVMCQTLADINKHINESYMFMSRIRWNLLEDTTPQVPQKQIKNLLTSTPLDPNFPLKVNQIWFGGNIPEWRNNIVNSNKELCKEYGVEYRLWKDEDRTKENFPITFDYQEKAIQVGKETNQNRLAQASDLARLEIIHNDGGIYIDSLIEITPAFLRAVTDAIKEGKTFIGCNEDPCDPPADCIGNDGRKYLSNGFFAATKGHPVLKNILNPDKLAAIDFSNKFINRTTGPYYLREGLEGTDMNTVFMFDSAQIYPYNQIPSKYKPEAIPNRFLIKTPVPGAIPVEKDLYYLPGGAEIIQNEFLVKNKGPLAIYHSGLGGTWSTA